MLRPDLATKEIFGSSLRVHGCSVQSVSEEQRIVIMRCVWVANVVLLIVTIQNATGVRVVVLRDSNSASEEDRSVGLSDEESEEIDLLMELIENEAKHRNPPPLTTVRLIKQIAEHSRPVREQIAQNTYTKERVESHPPNAFREYHVHYHTHQHKGPLKPVMPFDERTHPFVWSSQFPLSDFEAFRHVHKHPFGSHPKVKNTNEMEEYFRTNQRTPYPTYPPKREKIDPKVRLQALKDFENYVRPRIPSMNKNKPESSFVRMKKVQEFYDSEEEKVSFKNKNRFADFKDFSELENSDKLTKDEKINAENQDKKMVKIKDFAIVIKSRPRKPQRVVVEEDSDVPVEEGDEEEEGEEEEEEAEEERPGPRIPPFVNQLRVPPNRLFGMPKILDSAGGAPKYIDQLNQLRYPRPDLPMNYPAPFPFNTNAIDNDHRQLVPLRPRFPLPPPPPHPMPPYPHHPGHRLHPGWFLRRLMRKK